MTGAFSRVFALVLLCATPVLSQPQTCSGWGNCPAFTYTLQSLSLAKSYGVLVVVPKEAKCDVVRFRVHGTGRRNLGTTPPLLPGQVAVLRMGRGFAPGEHDLLIESSGCALHPSEARRVILGRASHDHSWRVPAASVLQ